MAVTNNYVNTKALGDKTPYILIHGKGGKWNAQTNVANVSTLTNHMPEIIEVINGLTNGGDIALIGKEEARATGRRKGSGKARAATKGA